MYITLYIMLLYDSPLRSISRLSSDPLESTGHSAKVGAAGGGCSGLV